MAPRNTLSPFEKPEWVMEWVKENCRGLNLVKKSSNCKRFKIVFRFSLKTIVLGVPRIQKSLFDNPPWFRIARKPLRNFC